MCASDRVALVALAALVIVVAELGVDAAAARDAEVTDFFDVAKYL